jgi:hypothetical protein
MRSFFYSWATRFATILVAAFFVFVASSSADGDGLHAKPACTHGLSSIGPVSIHGGRVVGGDTTPHTEACLP